MRILPVFKVIHITLDGQESEVETTFFFSFRKLKKLVNAVN